MGTIAKVTAGGSTHLIASTAYGTCSTAAGTVAKVATIQDSQAFTLINGTTVHIYFSNANTASSATLNVNSTGAKPIRVSGSATSSTGPRWDAGSVIAFTYNTNAVSGGAWVMNFPRSSFSATDISYYSDPESDTYLGNNVQDAMDAVADLIGPMKDKIYIYNFTVSGSAFDDATIISALNTFNATFAKTNAYSLLFLTNANSQTQAVLVHTQSVNYGGAKAVGFFSRSDFRLNSGTWSTFQTTYTATDSGVTITVVKAGDIVTVSFSGSTNKALAADATILTIASGYRPTTSVETTNTVNGGRLLIGTNGSVRVASATSSGVAVRGTITYICAPN